MKHILFINNIAKLDVKKDSTLLIAITLKQMGIETYLLFENDLYFSNTGTQNLKLHRFSGEFCDNDYYIKNFILGEIVVEEISSKLVIHMRIDPPVDSRYLFYLWQLMYLEKQGVKVINSPMGIIINNEKLKAYQHESSLESFVGTHFDNLKKFLTSIDDEISEFVIKPLDPYQGIGVR